MNDCEVLFQKIKNIIKIFHDKKNIEPVFLVFLKYFEIIKNWNLTHNIMSRNLSDYEILENIYDSIFGAEFLSKYFFQNMNNKKIVDVGSGGGLPGVPLAILFPELNFLLVDSNRKKCSFLRFVKSELNIENIEILNSNFDNNFSEELVITKAAFSPENSSALIQGLRDNGKLILWATMKTREKFIHEITKWGKLLDEKELSFDFKDRLFLVFEKEPAVPRGTN
jgi:16S rRNA (guanine(527)-N(7))-methyltransferase RsmG